MGSKVLTKVQCGLETAHGTPVPADTMLLCRVSLPDADREVKIPEVDIGARSGMLLDSAFTQKVLADGIGLEDADGAYFELFPLLFSMAIVTETATEVTSAQGDYLWVFAAPQTGAETIDSITLEVGDDTQGYEIGYVMARTINITGDCESGELHVSADLFGDKIIQTTVTADLSVPTAEFCNAKLATLDIDDSWAELGTNELAAALVNFDISLTCSAHPKFLGSATREFDSHGLGMATGTATFTFERTSGVATEELVYRPASTYAVTERFVRLTVTGGQIGTGAYQTLQIDMAGVWTSWSTLSGDREGNTLDVATLAVGYDSTGEQGFEVNVTTTVSEI